MNGDVNKMPKHGVIIDKLTRDVFDKKDFILELLNTWQNEVDVALLDSVYFIARKNMSDLVEQSKKTDLSTYSIISPAFIKDKINKTDKYYFVGQMFYLIYKWTDAGRKNYCNTNNATSDKILKKWLGLAKELKFFDGNFFNSDDYKKEYEIFLKNWGKKNVSS
jgi:hypothetical protein